ncbi:unnamed protein product [Arctia plantaginis]|uniref:Uncharacterized protein n=1 Tax=Arctia plantaginis TaxID=874455 RepID=A0A8S1AWA7_ARCPL|nr:unnamed protein product [Arctia plantaginis]
MNNGTEQVYLLNSIQSHPLGITQKQVPTHGTTPVNLENVDNFSNVCRTCATITQLVIPIFTGEGLEHHLAEKIHKHLPIKVSETDLLPLVVCYQCVSTLLAWHELVECCLQADRALKAKIGVDTSTETQKESQTITLAPSTTTEEDSQSKSYYGMVRNVLIKYFPQLSLEEYLDTEFVCQMCVEKPALTTMESLADHLKYDHSSDSKDETAIKMFIKNYVTFEEVLVFDDNDRCESKNTEIIEKPLPNLFCPYCASVFSSATRLVCHLNKHFQVTIEEGVMCCGIVYNNKKNFVIHLQENHVERKRDGLEKVCKCCGLEAEDASELQAHISDAHQKKEVCKTDTLQSPKNQKYIPAVCPECNKTFANKYSMFLHMKNHNAEIQCGEAFPTRTARDVHSRLHTGDKPYRCKYCGKCYRAKNTDDSQFLDVSETSDQTDDKPLSTFSTKKPEDLYCKFYSALVNFRNHFVGEHNIRESYPDFTDSSSASEVEENSIDSYDDLTQCNMRKDIMDKETRLELNQVQTKINGKIFYTCRICSKNLSSSHTYVFHKRIHTGERPCVCHICGKQFRAPNGLQRHLTETHERLRRYTCSLCPKNFANSQNLKQHLRIHTGERPFVCSQCGKRFTQSGSLHVHLKTHSAQFPHHCAECGAKFRLRSGLARHRLKHTGERPHVCALCGKGALVEIEIERGVVDGAEATKTAKPSGTATVASDGRKTVWCEKCNKSVSVVSWRRHLRLHNGEKRYSCHTCGRAFADGGNLARHARTLHARQRPFSCSICQKAFSRRAHLEDHEKSHSERREFVCDVCGKASKSSAALRMHARTHAPRALRCVPCGAAFRRAAELRAHRSVHSGERAHACACGRAFRLRTQLTQHQRTHHPDRALT